MEKEMKIKRGATHDCPYWVYGAFCDHSANTYVPKYRVTRVGRVRRKCRRACCPFRK